MTETDDTVVFLCYECGEDLPELHPHVVCDSCLLLEIGEVKDVELDA